MALNDLTGNPNANTPNANNNNNAGNGSGNNQNGLFGALSSLGHTPGSDDPLDYLINYNEKCKTSGTILFRDNVIRQTISTLICKDKPNPLLIGQAGVGKTKIVEDIAYRLANNDVIIPNQLKGYTIYEMPASSVMAGSSLVGQLEEKVQCVIDFISDPKNKAILFIDEIHQLLSDGDHYQKIAQILKPALARGDIKCIGATTLQESTVLFKDPAFNRRFSRIIVDELTQAQTFEVLKHSLPQYLKHYSNAFAISEDTLSFVVPIADQYVSIGSHRPDNALTVLDRTIANEILLRKLKEKELIDKTNDPDANIAQAAQQALTAFRSNPIINITESRIRNTAIKMMKGNAEQENTDFDILRENLASIKGQDDVIEKILKVLKNHEKSLFPTKKPLTFLFTGTSGVGKTELTKIISQTMTGRAPIVINMTEYSHSSAINQIIGSNIGYVGSESKIELPFDCLESNPYQIILLDEFEKGHKEVQRLFMRVFDEGLLKTNRGTTIDFSKAIIIATTNAAHKEVKKPLGFGSPVQSKSSEIEELKKWFDPELINRFEHIVNFNPITLDIYTEILKDIYAAETARIANTNRAYQFAAEIDEDSLKAMQKDFVEDFGARPAFNAVREYIENQI